jgi:saposin
VSLQCVEFMDSYATILFSKITEINPKEFCKQYGLCRDIALFSGVTSDNTCVFCHHLLDEIVSKLKDPDAEVTALCHLYISPTLSLPFCS